MTGPQDTKKEDKDTKSDDKGINTEVIFPAIVDFPSPTWKIAAYQTGRLLTTSRRQSTYVLISLYYDSNVILTEANTRSCQHTKTSRAYSE